MWVYPQAYIAPGHPAEWLPSESELRHQRFTSLGYGVKGFSDFLFISNSAGVDPDTGYSFANRTLTPLGTQLAPINAEIANITKSLVTLTPSRAYHMDGEAGVYGFAASDLDLPVNLRRTGKLTGATSTNGNKLQVSFFKDSANSEYFLVVNKNANGSSTGAALTTNVTLSFDGTVNKLRRLNRTNGQIETFAVSSNQHTFSLPGGTGDLFKYAGTPFQIQPKKQAAAVNLVYDDFEEYGRTFNASLPEVISVRDNRWVSSASTVSAFYATPGIIVYPPPDPAQGSPGTYGTSNGSNGLRNHPNGGLRGSDRLFPNGAVSTGKVTVEADFSLANPMQSLGTGTWGNLVLAKDPATGVKLINFQADGSGGNARWTIEPGSLGGLAGSIFIADAGMGKNFHLTMEFDLDAKQFVASVSGDATGTSGPLTYLNDFAPDRLGVVSGGHADTSFLTAATWDNLKVNWIAPPPLYADIDNDGRLGTQDVVLLEEAISAGTNFSYYDVNLDSTVNSSDLTTYLTGAALGANWKPTSGGSWAPSTSWDNATTEGVGVGVRFGQKITAASTVTTDGARTVGLMIFDNNNSYTITGSSTVTFDGGVAGDARLFVTSGSHTIENPVALANNTRITVTPSGSTMTLSGDVTAAAGVDLAKDGAGTLAMKHVRVDALTVSGGKLRVIQNGSTTGASKVTTATIDSGAQLDLTNNSLIVTGELSGSWNGSNYTGVLGKVRAGRGNGTWNGNGIVTSMTHATTSNVTTLAVATASEAGKSTFGGMSVSPADVLVMYTYGGDANLSATVDADDYFQIDSNYNKAASTLSYFKGDFDLDGDIDGDDYSIIDAGFSGQGSVSLGPIVSGVSAVPEPAATAGICMALAAASRRRRWRS
jgi:hypothetical protein